MIQPSSVLKGSGSRAHEPPDYSKSMRRSIMTVDTVWPTRSPLNRFGAAERRSHEHGSKHTDVCRHADEMVTVLLLTKLLQPSSAAEHPKPFA